MGLLKAGSVQGGLYGGVKRMIKIQTVLAQNSWDDSKYHDDNSQRADAQCILTKAEEAIKKRINISQKK